MCWTAQDFLSPIEKYWWHWQSKNSTSATEWDPSGGNFLDERFEKQHSSCLLLFKSSLATVPVQPLPGSTQWFPGFLMAGFGAVSAVPSEQGLLLQDFSPAWSVWSILMDRVQLTPDPQNKSDSALSLALLSVYCDPALLFTSESAFFFPLETIGKINIFLSFFYVSASLLVVISSLFMMEFALVRHCASCGWWKWIPPTWDFATI